MIFLTQFWFEIRQENPGSAASAFAARFSHLGLKYPDSMATNFLANNFGYNFLFEIWPKKIHAVQPTVQLPDFHLDRKTQIVQQMIFLTHFSLENWPQKIHAAQSTVLLPDFHLGQKNQIVQQMIFLTPFLIGNLVKKHPGSAVTSSAARFSLGQKKQIVQQMIFLTLFLFEISQKNRQRSQQLCCQIFTWAKNKNTVSTGNSFPHSSLP